MPFYFPLPYVFRSCHNFPLFLIDICSRYNRTN
nr:MAG TPA: hypothetical protein [Caudoviricetes sp.]